jgi:hypothetical protein
MRRSQARLVDYIQAARVLLAIRWGIEPERISDHRVKIEVERDARLHGEQVIGWVQ